MSSGEWHMILFMLRSVSDVSGPVSPIIALVFAPRYQGGLAGNDDHTKLAAVGVLVRALSYNQADNGHVLSHMAFATRS